MITKNDNHNDNNSNSNNNNNPNNNKSHDVIVKLIKNAKSIFLLP